MAQNNPSATSPGSSVIFESVVKVDSGGEGSRPASRFAQLRTDALLLFRLVDTVLIHRDGNPEISISGTPLATFKHDQYTVEANGVGHDVRIIHRQTNQTVMTLKTSDERDAAAWSSGIDGLTVHSKNRSAGGNSTFTTPPATVSSLPSASGVSLDAALHEVSSNRLAETRTPSSSRSNQLQPSSDFDSGATSSPPNSSEVSALRAQLKEARLRHEATMSAQKKALIEAGRRNFEEKKTLADELSRLRSSMQSLEEQANSTPEAPSMPNISRSEPPTAQIRAAPTSEPKSQAVDGGEVPAPDASASVPVAVQATKTSKSTSSAEVKQLRAILIAERKRFESSLSSVNEDCNGLRRELEVAIGRAEDAEKQLSSLVPAFEEQKSRIQELETHLSDLGASSEQHALNLREEMGGRIEELEVENAALRSDAEAMMADIKQLSAKQADAADTASQLEAAKQAIKQLKAQLQEAQEAAAENEEWEEKASNLQSRCNQLEHELDKERHGISDRRRQVEGMGQRLEHVETENEELKDQLNSADALREGLEATAAMVREESERRAAAYEQQVEDLQVRLAAAEQDAANMRESGIQMEERLEQASSLVSRYRAASDTATAEIEKERSKLNALRKQLAEAEEKQDAMAEEISGAADECFERGLQKGEMIAGERLRDAVRLGEDALSEVLATKQELEVRVDEAEDRAERSAMDLDRCEGLLRESRREVEKLRARVVALEAGPATAVLGQGGSPAGGGPVRVVPGSTSSSSILYKNGNGNGLERSFASPSSIHRTPMSNPDVLTSQRQPRVGFGTEISSIKQQLDRLAV